MLVTNFRLKYVLYKIVGAFYQLGDVARVHPMRERSLRALQRTVDFIEEKMPDALGFDTQRELLEHSLAAVTIDGFHMEFGVFTGGTMRFMARRAPKRTFDGFDSFEGLPESWSGFNLGSKAFDLKGRLPRVPANVRLHAGWFEDTIPKWMEGNAGPVAFMHIDCDLYSSTQTIFRLLAPRFVPGTIIVFDEYFNYPNWERHEHKAFLEMAAERGITFRYAAYARQQVAAVIETIRPGTP